MTVRPDFRNRGIGKTLYQARFDLVRRLNLRGWTIVGMLMGYHRYAGFMSPLDYAERVIYRQISDPTVTMQMNRGFRPLGIVSNYCLEEEAANTGVLMVWDNPDHIPAPETEVAWQGR